MPVSAETELSFADYRAMHLTGRKAPPERRLPTPAWALNDKSLRNLLVSYMEYRFRMRPLPDATLQERIERCRKAEIDQLPLLNAQVDRLNREYAATPSRALQIEIENTDTLIRCSKRGFLATVAAVVYLYHRCHMDSVGVAAETGLKPPHVRMILYRMAALWARRFNQDGTKKPVVKTRRRTFNYAVAFQLRQNGLTYVAIARELGVKLSTVAFAVREFALERKRAEQPTPGPAPAPTAISAGNL